MEKKRVFYMLKGIDQELWNELKIRAIREGITLRELVTRALKAYISPDKKRKGK